MKTTDTARTASLNPQALRITAAAGIAALGLCAAWAAPAWAHDTLISSTPEAGEVLEEAPAEIVLEFSGSGLTVGEGITNDIQVHDDDGEDWASDEPAEVSGSTMSTDLRDELPNGDYEVLYRVVYSDGHDEQQSFEFTVDAPVEAEEEGAGQADGVQQDEAAADSPGADETSPAPEVLSEDEAASEENPAIAEDSIPTWAPIAFAGGAFAIIVVVLILVRQKLKQSESWKDDPENPGPGGPGSGPDADR
ncbi:copper resistance CopC family protein [Nesterenkonia flava]|uniref:Copper resistance protein CopC n=1 Tax=Nesterenkonia flava TaxID=469799 RepID=A0ABU1FRW6_9MICC|nr:copper resistance protein CopC [Nesterenkonia flava]MDR5710898.1 copper resistance protein CopC [Nesterenkonia flava]